MNDSSSQTDKRLWLLSGVLFLGAAVGAGSLLLGYGAPGGARHAQSSEPLAAVKPGALPAQPAAHAGSTSLVVVPTQDLPVHPVAPGAIPDPETFINQRFPYQVIADVKFPSAEENEKQVRAAFPDYAKVLDENAKNPSPATNPAPATQLPAPLAPGQMPPTDAER